jgi:uncharacterized protein (TIGR02145 family)
MKNLSLIIIAFLIFSMMITFWERTSIKEVTIGQQVWMTENLDTEKFQNGDPILQARSSGEWKAYANDGTPAWCYYEKNPLNGKKHGKLYNWYAVNDPRGLAPNGWHIPNNDEWRTLADYLGGDDIAGNKMKSKNAWSDYGNGTNESGFNGFPSGYCLEDGSFTNMGKFGFWWSLTENDEVIAWYSSLFYKNSYLSIHHFSKSFGFSVRCIKN